MIFLVTIYAFLSGLGFVTALISAHYVPMFAISVLSAAAFYGGREFQASVENKASVRTLGHIVSALFLVTVSLYLGWEYSVPLYHIIVPGFLWSMVGLVVGAVTHPAKMPFPERFRLNQKPPGANSILRDEPALLVPHIRP